jgi:ribosome-interacting GTPase 1
VEHWVFDLIRGADLVWVVVDCTDSLDGLDTTERLLSSRKIMLRPVGSAATKEHPAGHVEKPALLVVTGRDRPECSGNLRILQELLDRPWPVLPVSALDNSGLEELAESTFAALEVIRVYTKQPGKPPDRDQPFTIPAGSTVACLARVIHKDLVRELKFARVWGEQVFDGQTVQQGHVLADRDVVEIHT